MYFDFEDQRPDTPRLARPLSTREGVMVTAIIHLLAVILILVAPRLPFMKELEAKRQQALEEQRLRELQHEKENRQFVFVQPRSRDFDNNRRGRKELIEFIAKYQNAAADADQNDIDANSNSRPEMNLKQRLS